ncbi:MAG: hypothetical protein ACLURV_07265 [Gallintestinimicrobium sp.]
MSPVVKKKRKKITITSQQLLLVLTAVCAFLLIFTFNTNVFEGVLKQRQATSLFRSRTGSRRSADTYPTVPTSWRS